nr:hypothetical protein [Tanacetum cinerariifolium]
SVVFSKPTPYVLIMKMNVLMMMFILFNLVYNLEASLSRVINLESKSKAEMVSNPVSNPDSESGANSGSIDKCAADGATVGEDARGVLDGKRSLKANLQHMEALSTTEAGYMTFTKAWKKKIWLKGLLIES